MLVLTRKVGEKILIGKDITVEIIEMQCGRIRVGITAPKDVGILRAELVDRSQDKKEE